MQPRSTPPAVGSVNLTDSENYLILDARGRGHFVGAHLSVHNISGGSWNEGDDMFMIDGRKWPPDMHGTGSEDYFCQVCDPVIFHESLRFSIGHGHANCQSDDYTSVAYWYQAEPHHDFAPLPPAEKRLPVPDIPLGPADLPGPRKVLTAKRDIMRRGLTGRGPGVE